MTRPVPSTAGLGEDAPSVSVVLTCYREGERLLRAYRSLEEQTDQRFEIVIVNDASPDAETNQVVRELESLRRAKVIWRRANGGPAIAKNHGVQAMAGDIVVPLDGDDTLPSDAIATIREGFARFDQAGYLFGDYVLHDTSHGTEKLVDCSVLCDGDNIADPRRFISGWRLLGTSPCRKSVWLSVGGHRKEFAYDTHDVDFFLRLAQQNVKGYYVKKTIYVWNRSATGINSTVADANLVRLYVANLPFYDRFGDGNGMRWYCLNCALEQSDFVSAQIVARQLVTRGFRSRQLAALAICPPRLYPRLQSMSKHVQIVRSRAERRRPARRDGRQ